MNQPGPRVLVPPRPNLGPEPWSETSSIPVLGIFLVLAALGFGAFWIILRRGATRRRPTSSRAQAAPPEDSPAAQLLVLSGVLREALATRFGPSLRAWTTEEIASDPQLREALGDQHLDELIRLLATADRLKFAPVPDTGREEPFLGDLSTWQAWHKTFLAEFPPQP